MADETKVHESIKAIRGGLVVSCQASAGEPLCRPDHILALSLSVLAGGAIALRLEGVDNIACVRKEVQVPLVGLVKSDAVPESQRLSSVYITGTFAEARAIADSGADIIAFDATGRPRPDGLTVEEFVGRAHESLDKPVWADVSTVEEGLFAAEYGADVVSTTLCGYTDATRSDGSKGPALDVLAELIKSVRCPVVLEGKVWSPDEVEAAFALGAWAVVVGSAITRPQLITRRFVQAARDVKP